MFHTSLSCQAILIRLVLSMIPLNILYFYISFLLGNLAFSLVHFLLVCFCLSDSLCSSLSCASLCPLRPRRSLSCRPCSTQVRFAEILWTVYLSLSFCISRRFDSCDWVSANSRNESQQISKICIAGGVFQIIGNQLWKRCRQLLPTFSVVKGTEWFRDTMEAQSVSL